MLKVGIGSDFNMRDPIKYFGSVNNFLGPTYHYCTVYSVQCTYTYREISNFLSPAIQYRYIGILLEKIVSETMTMIDCDLHLFCF